MSHYNILIKIKADSDEEAIDAVKSELDDTVTDGNRAGFDYVSDEMKILTKKDFPKGITSFEQLEEEWGKNSRRKEMDRCLGMIRDSIRMSLARKHLPLKDIPLLLKSKDWSGEEDVQFSEILEKRLKSNKEGKLPRNFTELLNLVMNILSSLTETFGSLNLYLLKQIGQLTECEQYKEKYYLLNTLNNHFADLSDEYKGKNIYYVLADRHA